MCKNLCINCTCALLWYGRIEWMWANYVLTNQFILCWLWDLDAKLKHLPVQSAFECFSIHYIDAESLRLLLARFDGSCTVWEVSLLRVAFLLDSCLVVVPEITSLFWILYLQKEFESFTTLCLCNGPLWLHQQHVYILKIRRHILSLSEMFCLILKF